MNISELIEAAREKRGSLSALAEGLDMHPNRLTDWKAGRRKPDASEIAYLAQQAELPIFETVAEIEAQLNGRYARIWNNALEHLRAAGVAATLFVCIAIASMLAPHNANAATSGTLPSHGRGHWFDPSTTHQIHGYVGSPKKKGPQTKV